MIKSEIVCKERKMGRKNCEQVKIKEFSRRGVENLVGNDKILRLVTYNIF